ncbi:MAG: ABC transporter permease subunit [Chloroflexi bacterium]|nr:ABC transporter permease subunit [Chloroflexota bacterium]
MMPMQDVLRLARWEWFKLRRLRLPWVLLAVAVLVSQLGIWTNYVAYHNDAVHQVVNQGDSSISLSPDEWQGTAVTATCVGIARGRLPTGFDGLTEEQRNLAQEHLDAWRSEDCGNTVTLDELRRGFTLPNSITASVSGFSSLGPVAIGLLLIMVLTASLVGTEYGWGTLRTVLAGGIGRWTFLSAKLLLLLCVCAGVLIVIAAASIASSLAAALVPPDEAGVLLDSGTWYDVLIVSLKSVYGFLPFIALSVFATALTASRGMGISISVGYFIVESIVAPLLHFNDTLGDVADYLLIQGFRSWTAVPTGEPSSDTLQSFAAILGYTLFLFAGAFWIFKRRDISGAMGD